LKHNEKSFYDMWGFGRHGQLNSQEGIGRKGLKHKPFIDISNTL
jgi:hypothetical protein